MEYLIIIMLVYFAPTIAAPAGRRVSVGVINLAFGWTFVGWFAAFYMAARSREEIRERAEQAETRY